MFDYDTDFDVLVFGHTHYPAFWKKNNKLVVNPGSVGQARNNNGAYWAILDTKTLKIEFFNEKYNINPLLQMCKEKDPNIQYLQKVLIRNSFFFLFSY